MQSAQLLIPAHEVLVKALPYSGHGLCRHEIAGLFPLKGKGCRGRRRRILVQAGLLELLGGQGSKGQLAEKQIFAPWDKVKLGNLVVSPMGLGTWAWGNRFLWNYREEEDEELQQVFNLVVSRGINLFDTADSYGTGQLSGRSEQLLGKFIKEYPGSTKVRSQLVVATKFAAYPWRLTTAQMLRACRASAVRLDQDVVPLAQLHWSTANYAPAQEQVLWDSLVAMYDQGLVRAVGVSNYGPKQLQRIYKFLQQRKVPLASAQVQFSLLSCGPDQQAMKAACDDLGVRMIAYSPLALGMLARGAGGTAQEEEEEEEEQALPPLPKGPRGLLFRQVLPGAAPLLRALRAIGRQRNKTVPQVALNWCICKGTIPIPGARNMRQASENLGALGWRLSASDVQELDKLASQVPQGMVQNIFQTK